MKRAVLSLLVIVAVCLFSGCASAGRQRLAPVVPPAQDETQHTADSAEEPVVPPGDTDENQSNKKAVSYNLKIIILDEHVDNPDSDRRCYYRIFIDKIEAGRSTTGLESQEKTFECMLDINRHLVTVEKWVLDEYKGKYIKLNNIEQPRPNFAYFEIDGRRIVLVRITNDIRSGETAVSVSFEGE